MSAESQVAKHATRILTMHARASDVLEDPTIAMQWLLMPTALLNGDRPIDALATQNGYDRVYDILLRLEKGVGL